MYNGQGRKQIKPITRYESYDMSGEHTMMTEAVLYEHSVAYLRVYVYHPEFTRVTSKRISMKVFRSYENDVEFVKR